MIDGLDHIVVAVEDFDAAADGYRRLLGHEPAILTGGGARRAWFQFPNAALEVIAVDGVGPAADRVKLWLRKGPGVAALAFHVADLEATARLLTRRGLAASAPAANHLTTHRGFDHVMRTATCAEDRTAGIPVVLVGRGDPVRTPEPAVSGPISALDHVVITTPNPDRALAIYGAKLGLDLRLDRENPGWNARQLFFRCGDAVVEIGARLGASLGEGPDQFGGLAWRVAEPELAQARIAAAGFDVSEVRAGRKPGTKVFTVRDAPGGVPTIMLSAEPQKEAA